MKDNLDFKAIGKRIKEMRTYKNMSQEQLAKTVDTTSQYISAIENGTSKASLSAITAIANAFECSIDELLYDSSKYAADTYDAEAKLILSDCTPNEKDTLIKFMQYAKENIREHYGTK